MSTAFTPLGSDTSKKKKKLDKQNEYLMQCPTRIYSGHCCTLNLISTWSGGHAESRQAVIATAQRQRRQAYLWVQLISVCLSQNTAIYCGEVIMDPPKINEPQYPSRH